MEEAELKRLTRIARISIGRGGLKGLEKDINDILKLAYQLKRLEVRQPDVKRGEKKFRDDRKRKCRPGPILKNFPKREGRFLEVPRSL